MAEAKTVICTVCPVGCHVEVWTDRGEVIEIRKNKCKRGEAYAAAEVVNPVRTLTTTVRLEGGASPMLPVRSAAPVPKRILKDCAAFLSRVRIKAPVKVGDVVVPNILESGVDIIASKSIE